MDTALWAVLRYAEADFATVARAQGGKTLPSVTVGAPPARLLASVDLANIGFALVCSTSAC